MALVMSVGIGVVQTRPSVSPSVKPGIVTVRASTILKYETSWIDFHVPVPTYGIPDAACRRYVVAEADDTPKRVKMPNDQAIHCDLRFDINMFMSLLSCQESDAKVRWFRQYALCKVNANGTMPLARY